MPRPLHTGYSHYNWLLMEYQYDPVRTGCARRPALARPPRFIHTSYALAALCSRERAQPVALHAACAPPHTCGGTPSRQAWLAGTVGTTHTPTPATGVGCATRIGSLWLAQHTLLDRYTLT
jgi:hypothetical protein